MAVCAWLRLRFVKKTMEATTVMPATGERISLYYKEGGSDKVYQASLEPAGPRWVVNFAFGRRGSTLNTGTKTNVPVDYDKAKVIYDKTVREKMAKGYTPGQNGTPYQHTDKEARSTGILPQLLNPIEEKETLPLLQNRSHCMQEKFDGRRVLLRKQGGAITGINRKGLTIGLPVPIVERANLIEGDFILDGECVGETLHVFDLLEWKGEDLRTERYVRRLAGLEVLLGEKPGVNLTLVPTAFEPHAKDRMLSELLRAKHEGVVFKHLDAPYTPGRPSSGGPQLKHKFYSTLSAMAGEMNTQRSVKLHLLGPNGWQPAGNVTIPPNRPLPRRGEILEIRYLYCLRESGCLFQPTCLGPRPDLEANDCTTAQLKFKSGEEDET